MPYLAGFVTPQDYGAAGNGTSDDTTAIQAAVTAVLATSTGGIVYFPSGTYKTTSTVTAVVGNNQTLRIVGAGQQATVIAFAGTGDCIRMHNTNSFTTGMNISWGTGVRDLMIDGTNAGAGSTGLHIGDMSLLKCDFEVQNFSGAGDIGLHLDNAVTWTEESEIRATLINCTQHVVYEVTTGTNSFGYSNHNFTIYGASNQQDGVVLKNGPDLYHSNLMYKGNIPAGASVTTAAVLRLIGVAPVGTPSAGFVSSIYTSHMDVNFECSSGTHAPQAIYLDPSNYAVINACYGAIQFDSGPTNFAASTTTYGQIFFDGIVNDPTGTILPQPAGSSVVPYLWRSTLPTAGLAGQSSFISGSTLDVPACTGDFFAPVVLSVNVTVSLTPGNYNGGHGLGAPQRITILIQQAAAGGPFTVAWPHTGSPSLTSPTVKWPGGTAPTMTASANAVDQYDLVTGDGIIWYGVAHQAMA